jgi:hypothetical protein
MPFQVSHVMRGDLQCLLPHSVLRQESFHTTRATGRPQLTSLRERAGQSGSKEYAAPAWQVSSRRHGIARLSRAASGASRP